MTEGNGHVIDPNGDARRALQEAVAEHGPEVLSDPAVIDTICRDHLAGLPGESILIGDAARTNVPALLGDLIPQLGNYGAIQSAAATLAGEHSLDMAASWWVVREFARALGYIAPATGASAAFPGSGPRPVPGSGPRPVPGSGLAAGAGAAERPAGTGGATGAGEGSGTPGAGSGESENAPRGGGEAGRAAVGGAAAGAAGAAGASGVAAGEAGRGETPGRGVTASGTGPSRSGGSGSGTGASGQAGTGGETIPRGVAASRAAGSGSRAGQVAGEGSGIDPGYGTAPARGGTGQASGSPGAAGQPSGAPGTTGTAGGGPGVTGPAGSGTGTTGPADGGAGATGPAGGGPSAPGATPGSGTPASGTGGGGTGGGGTGGSGGWGGGTGGAAPEGDPGFPLPLPAGRLPGRQPQRAKLLNRNTVGIAAAIALVAGYLGVAAVAHLSPFPAKTVPSASSSQSSSPPASTSSSPASSPDPSADPTPSSQFDILLTKIPPAVRDQNNCKNNGTGFGATAVSQCQQLRGLGAGTILYYLYPSRAALAQGFSTFLRTEKFSKKRECTTNGNFSDFLVECESDFTIKTPGMTGSIAEYVNSSTAQNPVIVSTDNEQDVMVIMVGTNDGDLLAYWNKLEWVVTS